jgi:M61 glycyl aminopeptidase
MLGGVVLLCVMTSIANAQMTVAIRVQPEAPRRVLIEGSRAPTVTWSFRDSYASVLNLGSRIEHFQLFDAAGAEIPTRKVAPGQFDSPKPASRFRYEVSLDPPVWASDAAFVSWLGGERGLLMLGDLLPLANLPAVKSTDSAATREKVLREDGSGRATLRLSLPEGWAGYTNEQPSPSGEFQVPDIGRAVFAVGRRLRLSRTTVSRTELNLVVDGEWAFADRDALELAEKVLKAHLDVFGGKPSNKFTLILIPFPQAAAAERWSAETRGSTVTLLMGKLPSKTAALAQLSVPLTHELFHPWVPNGLALGGDYDWFYEGFTVYHAARTAVRLDLLTFQEFLNAFARAFDAYAASADRDRWTLIEASRRRWTAGGSVVYQKSMLVAFLYDLKLRSQSRGKRSLDDVYREVFRLHHSGEQPPVTVDAARAVDGNQAVVTVLEGAPGMRDFAASFIRSAAPIDLPAELAPFGLRVERLGLRNRISVSATLTSRQRDLLRDLGYNDYARSRTQKKS